jgi:hypothetical protein
MTGAPRDPRKRRSEASTRGRLGGVTRVDSTAVRRRVGRFEVLDSARWLTKRDQDICQDLFDHRVLNSIHLRQLYFTHPRIASRRLKLLWERRLLDRFQPKADTGSAPFHYVLDELGAHVIASTRGLDIKKVRDRIRDDALLFTRWTFAHRMELNDFFCTLTWATRRSAECRRLSTWWSEGRCVAEWDGLIRPDGFAQLDGRTDTCRFLLELDRGTERGPRLADKLEAYAWFARVEPDAADAVVFLFPTPEREVAARDRLSAVPDLCVATSTRELFYRDPLGPVWLPAAEDRRVPLLWLPLVTRRRSTP